MVTSLLSTELAFSPAEKELLEALESHYLNRAPTPTVLICPVSVVHEDLEDLCQSLVGLSQGAAALHIVLIPHYMVLPSSPARREPLV